MYRRLLNEWITLFPGIRDGGDAERVRRQCSPVGLELEAAGGHYLQGAPTEEPIGLNCSKTFRRLAPGREGAFAVQATGFVPARGCSRCRPRRRQRCVAYHRITPQRTGAPQWNVATHRWVHRLHAVPRVALGAKTTSLSSGVTATVHSGDGPHAAARPRSVEVPVHAARARANHGAVAGPEHRTKCGTEIPETIHSWGGLA